MRGYPLSEADMRDLSKTQTIAAICFSTAAGLLGFNINLAKDLAFAQNVPPQALGFWSAISWACWLGVIVSTAFGLMQYFSGKARLKEIMDQTTHDES